MPTYEPLLPTPNTLDSLEPKSLERIVAHNQKARPGRSYLSMNLRELIAYGPRNLNGTPMEMLPTPSAQMAGEKIIKTLTTKDGSPAVLGKRAYNPKTGFHVQITLNRAISMESTYSRPAHHVRPLLRPKAKRNG